MPANYVLGKDCKSYQTTTLATSTTYTTQMTAATELANIKDLKLNFQTDKADVSTRASGGWKNEVNTVKSGTITFTMQWKPGDTLFNQLRDAFLNATEIFFAALDGPKATAGNQGPAGNWTVTNFSRSEGLNEAVTVDVELSPSSFTGWFTAP